MEKGQGATMVAIPEKRHSTETAIESRVYKELPRPYLGMSGLGHECLRYLWLSFRWCYVKETTARQQRIFNRGHLEERRIVRDLNAVGITTFKMINGQRQQLTGEVGEKQEEMIGFAGHAKGHPDGRCLGVIESPKTEHLLEMKTCANKYFNDYVKNGVEIANYTYYAQMQRYMHALGLTRALFIVTNKDNEQRYYERVYYNKIKAEELVRKEQEVILSEYVPRKPFDKSYYKCKWCDARPICHYGVAPPITCRTCAHVDILDEGKWSCGLNKKELSPEDQKNACGFYRLKLEP